MAADVLSEVRRVRARSVRASELESEDSEKNHQDEDELHVIRFFVFSRLDEFRD